MEMIIQRTRILLRPYILGLAENLEHKLSLFDIQSRTYTDRLFAFDDKSNTLSVPIGFGPTNVVMCLKAIDINDINITTDNESTVKPRAVQMSMRDGVKIRDSHQDASVRFLVSDEDTAGIRYLTLQTGYGKTFVATTAAVLSRNPVLVLTDTTVLAAQWKKCIIQYTDIQDDQIIMINGIQKLKSVMRNHHTQKVYICNTHTASSAADSSLLEEFTERCRIGTAIIDEAHKMFVAVTRILLSMNVRRTFLLSATPSRSDYVEKFVYDAVFKNVEKFGEYTHALQKYIHVMNLTYDTEPSVQEIFFSRTRAGFSAVKYETFIMRNERKLLWYANIVKKMTLRLLKTDPEAKILALFTLNETIERVRDVLSNVTPNVRIGVLNSTISKDTKTKIVEDNNLILSTIKSAGAGIDVKNLRMTICFESFKSPVVLSQLMGRLRQIDGKAVFYVNCVDLGFPDCVRQNNHRQDIFRKKAVSVKTMSLDYHTFAKDPIRSLQE